MRRFSRAPLCLLLFAGFVFTTSGTCTAGEAPSPEAVVRAFNAAISGRDLDAALATLATGAVNFNFGSVHGFSASQGVAEPLTSDLALHWRTVAPVLYSASRRYERRIEQATTHIDGALAVVWALLRTTTEPKSGDARILEFSETYLLRLDKGEWKIAGIANARPTR